jgi:hypothetical protein
MLYAHSGAICLPAASLCTSSARTRGKSPLHHRETWSAYLLGFCLCARRNRLSALCSCSTGISHGLYGDEYSSVTPID